MSGDPADAVGSVAEALAHADRLISTAPAVAARQAEAVLTAVPNHPRALLILAMAKARLDDWAGARAILEPLSKAQPRAAAVHQEWAAVLAACGETGAAIAALRHAVGLKPDLPQAWRMLADLLILHGQDGEADAAYAQHLRASLNDPELMEAAARLCAGDLPVAERMLRSHLKGAPTDVAAIRMLAEVATRLGRYPAAERLLTRCLELAPGFAGARHNFAVVLYRQNRAAEALPHLQRLVAEDPGARNYQVLLAAVLAATGQFDRAVTIYGRLTRTLPEVAKLWLSYGHALRTAGRRDEAVAAYRTSLERAPGLGEAYWSLANLKTSVFTSSDIETMRQLIETSALKTPALDTSALATEDRFHLHYALGRALEEQGAYKPSFANYAAGAALRRQLLNYDPEATTAHQRAATSLLTAEFYAQRAGWGCRDAAPIFIVGLPRSGSTLIEQILASHSAVEGTMELPELAAIAEHAGAWQPGPKNNAETSDSTGWAAYLHAMATMDAGRAKALGEEYIERTRIYRRLKKPFFIDKMPNNFLRVGLIRLILPRAKIIDARRHPMATCFSAFKQHFARGQNYTYEQNELGRFYCDYVALMAHFDRLQPGTVHRVHYETMVDETEAEIHRLLTYCGLEFEPSCIRFHENDRPVRTASSEQVRRPIFREGLDQWRHFQPWLGPLEKALAPILGEPVSADEARRSIQSSSPPAPAAKG